MTRTAIRIGSAVALAMAVAAGPAAGAGAAVDVGSSGGAEADSFCFESYVTCKGDGLWHVPARVDTVGGSYKGPLQGVVGEPVTFELETIQSGITSVTHRAPEGFEFVGAEVIAHDWTPGRYPYTTLPSTTTVDPEAGTVTVTAGEGGWPVPIVELPAPYSTTRPGFVYVQMRYLPTQAIRDGESAVSFTATGVPAPAGWTAVGKTTVTATPAASGSSAQ